jgi:hypothetical protein
MFFIGKVLSQFFIMQNSLYDSVEEAGISKVLQARAYLLCVH